MIPWSKRHRRLPLGASADWMAHHGLQWVEVAPESCDPRVTSWREPHLIAYDPTAAPCQRLWVFLCGSYGIPVRHRLLTAYAARLGYCAIGLSYPNSWTVGGICRGEPDLDCHKRVRLDILDGGRRSGLVPVGPADALLQRLRSLLEYLVAHHPQQGWGRFIAEGEIDWSAVVIAGHSQGSGHAALIGKLYPVARVVMFAGPADQIRSLHLPAPWLSEAGMTHPSRYFGFVHRADPGFDKIRAAWVALGLGDHLTEVDQGLSTAEGPHCLVTDYMPVPRERYHNCLTQDQMTPKRLDGKPVFEGIWRYLFAFD